MKTTCKNCGKRFDTKIVDSNICISCKNNPFRIEEYRDKLSQKQKLTSLEETYSDHYKEIKDLNSSSFWNDIFKNSSGNDGPMADDRNSIFFNYLKELNGKFIDVGFGEGQLLNKLSESKLELYGIDISTYSVSEVKKSVNGVFKQGSIYKIPFGNSEFDIALSSEVLEHIPPSKTFTAFKELRRILKKGGQLIVSVPYNEGLEEMLQSNYNPNGHVRTYTPTLLTSELKLNGFEVKKVIFLYAFNKHYKVKKRLAKFLKDNKSANNILIFSVKK